MSDTKLLSTESLGADIKNAILTWAPEEEVRPLMEALNELVGRINDLSKALDIEINNVGDAVIKNLRLRKALQALIEDIET